MELREQAATGDPRDARAVRALEPAYSRNAPVLLKLGCRREALDNINRASPQTFITLKRRQAHPGAAA